MTVIAATIINQMVNNGKQLDLIFGALSDLTRREILAHLSNGSATVMELARPFRISLPAISKHIRVLENAKLIRRVKDGRFRRVSLVARPLKEVSAWIESYRVFWENRFDSLDDHLKAMKEKKNCE